MVRFFPYLIHFSFFCLALMPNPTGPTSLFVANESNSALKPPVCNAAKCALRASRSNPRYFEDASGKTIYLAGSHTWNNFQTIGASGQQSLDYEEYLAFLKKYNHNFFRLWVWENAAWTPSVDGKVIFDPIPYERTGPGTGIDGKPKCDLTRFNDRFFKLLADRVVKARDRGIYVSVMLFQGFSIDRKGTSVIYSTETSLHRMIRKLGFNNLTSPDNNPWNGHPFNLSNNINGINGDPRKTGEGKDVHTLALPAITKVQERYVRKMIETLAPLDNVLWEISNESHAGSTAWQYHMIDFIRSTEESLGCRHPILMTVQYPGGNNAVLFQSKADAISPNDEGGYKNNPPPANGQKVIISDTDHLWGVGGDFRWVWKTFLRGGNPIFMDPYFSKGLGWDKQDPEWKLIRKNLGYTRRYAERIDLAHMLPRPELASSGFCLANPGREYLVYMPASQDLSIDLTAASSTYFIEIMDLQSGTVSKGKPIKGGSRIMMPAHGSGDSVVYLFTANNISHSTHKN